MLVENYGVCPNCGVETEGMLPKYCHDCGTALEWKERTEYFPPKPDLPADPIRVMRCGTVNCDCGQQFYFESLGDAIQCIQCRETYSTLGYPEKEGTLEGLAENPIEIEAGEEDGTDI